MHGVKSNLLIMMKLKMLLAIFRNINISPKTDLSAYENLNIFRCKYCIWWNIWETNRREYRNAEMKQIDLKLHYANDSF